MYALKRQHGQKHNLRVICIKLWKCMGSPLHCLHFLQQPLVSPATPSLQLETPGTDPFCSSSPWSPQARPPCLWHLFPPFLCSCGLSIIISCLEYYNRFLIWFLAPLWTTSPGFRTLHASLFLPGFYIPMDRIEKQSKRRSGRIMAIRNRCLTMSPVIRQPKEGGREVWKTLIDSKAGSPVFCVKGNFSGI